MRPILEASLINCHAEDLDSIVFKETSPMVRMFVARAGHTLWKNHPGSGEYFSVALHMHRQDITMVPLLGTICNVSMHYAIEDLPAFFTYHTFDYSSQILDGKGGFIDLNNSENIVLEMVRLHNPLYLPGHIRHSVYVPKGQVAAWLICEGRQIEKYSSVCYSNDEHLDKTDFSMLYKPMTEERLVEDMGLVNLMNVRG